MTPEEVLEIVELVKVDSNNIKRCLETLKSRSIQSNVIIHSKTDTTEASARKTNISEERVVKTLIFKLDGEPAAVLCTGETSVDEEKLAAETGSEYVEMASPGEVKEVTGYVVGSVSPFDLDIPVYADKLMVEREMVRPAAGSRVVGVELDPKALVEAIDAEVAAVSRKS